MVTSGTSEKNASFMTHMKNVSLCNDQSEVGRLTNCTSVAKKKNQKKTFNVAIYLVTINMINVKLHKMAVLTEIYPFMPFSVTLVLFQG